MNCILFGLGPHANRIYLPYLEKEDNITNVVIVDLKNNEERIKKILSTCTKKYTVILLNNSIRNLKILPEKDEKLIIKNIKALNIKHGIISTEPRSHKMYIEFCLKYNISIMCDKPITAPLYTNTEIGYKNIVSEYMELLNMWKYSDSNMFEIQTQRRAHSGYKYIWNVVNEVVEKYGVPINKISLTHSDGNWNMPSEVIYRENHPYKYGYGKLMHSGYHFIDLLTWFMNINQNHGFIDHNKKYYISDYRPSDFYNFFDRKFHEKINFIDNISFYENLNIIKNLGELDLSAIIEYQDEKENIICTAHMELSQSGVSRRSWFDLPEDTYKGNGRIRHEFFNVTVGPLLNIKVLSFQSTEISEGNILDNNVGDLNHFEILIFRNSNIIGGLPFEKLSLKDISDDNMFYLGQNEKARFEILDGFFKYNKSYSCIDTHKESIQILSEMYKKISERYDNNFRFAVEAIIKYNNKFLLCKRKKNLKIAPGIWNVPAGKVKNYEGIEEAIIREVKEEVNLEIENVKYLGYHFINKEHKRLVFTYFTEVQDISNFKLDISEFDEYVWEDIKNIDQYKTLSENLKKHIKEIG